MNFRLGLQAFITTDALNAFVFAIVLNVDSLRRSVASQVNCIRIMPPFFVHVCFLRVDCLLTALDGAFFGTSFAHLFFMTFDRLVPEPPKESYTPLIFGFKVHK